MSHHQVQEENLTHEEIMYNYHILRGSDFTKIDLFLSARNNYKLALKYKPEDPFSLKKIQECSDQIKSDRKKVLMIVPFVLALITTVICLNL